MAMAQFTWAILLVAAVVQRAMPAEGMIDIEQNVQRVQGTQLCRGRGEGSGRAKCFQPLAFMNVLGKSMLVQVLVTLFDAKIFDVHNHHSPSSPAFTGQMYHTHETTAYTKHTNTVATDQSTHTHTHIHIPVLILYLHTTIVYSEDEQPLSPEMETKRSFLVNCNKFTRPDDGSSRKHN